MLHRALLGVTLASAVTLFQAAAIQHPFTASPLQQPKSTSPTDWPYRPLPWGELNVLHTTDTHGWLLGHQQGEAAYSGDWGDYYSFVHRMEEEAKRRGVDLLLVDTGDRVDGNGLVDADPVISGHTAMEFFQQVPYDVITTGNHELYRYPVAKETYTHIAKHFDGRYLTSNYNITIPAKGGKALNVVAGSRCRKFKTEQGRNVTAFGTLFDFKAHAPGTTVQKPSEMVKEEWFQEAIRERPDVFLVAGHMTIRDEPDSEFTAVFNAIRIVHPTVPILIFGGHHHIRDCAQEDDRSMSLASGRYMETIGFMSVSGLDGDDELPLQFGRRYLDQNRNSYIYHAGPDFDTKKGREISHDLGRAAASFNITTVYGVAPQTYWQSRYPPTSEHSVLNLLTSEVLPLLVTRPDRGTPHVILNTGSIRFDIFAGPFTRNTQWIIMPFANQFVYLPDVPRGLAEKLLGYLNLVGEHGFRPATSALDADATSTSLSPAEAIAADDARVQRAYHHHLAASAESYVSAAGDAKLSLGYVTQDSCSELGDDVLHRPVPSEWQPTFVATGLPAGGKVDVVFFDFLIPDLVGAMNHLQKGREYSSADVRVYLDELKANNLVAEYAKLRW